MKYSIYALVDPRDLHIRYIGQTFRPLRRQTEHKCRTRTPLKSWLAELRSLDLAPQLVVFQQVDTRAEALRVEAHWIRQFLAEGAVLLNKVGRPKPLKKYKLRIWEIRAKQRAERAPKQGV